MASNIVELSNRTKISVVPFMDSGYLFKSMFLDESIGGDIAYGKVSFTSDGSDLSLITDQETVEINIVKEEGITYKIKGFITSRDYLGNEVDINFLCCDKKFIVDQRVVTYTDISDAINSLYSLNKNITVESDINNEIEINQNGITDYELCKKLARSYKYNTIFAFGLEGFMIKDVNQNDSNAEVVSSMSDNTQLNKFSINYYKQFEINPELNESSDNILSISNNQDNYLLHKSYDQLMSNYLYNTRYTTDFYTNFSTKYIATIPDYKLGDLILYRNNDKFPRTKYIVSRISIDIRMSDVTTTVSFRGIDKGDSL